MKTKSLFKLIMVGTALAWSLGMGASLAKAEGGHPEDHFDHLPEGGRKSLHGMVLFGSGPYFLEHIPMFTAPHDFQIIVKAQLTDKNGKPVSADFSNQGFTLKPSTTFSLNDYVAGRLKSFSGAIHQGSFELGGQMLPGMSDITVEVLEYKLIRQLPAEANQSVIELNDGTNTFESKIIGIENGVQHIRNTKSGAELWCVKGPDFFEPCP